MTHPHSTSNSNARRLHKNIYTLFSAASIRMPARDLPLPSSSFDDLIFVDIFTMFNQHNGYQLNRWIYTVEDSVVSNPNAPVP